MATIKDVARVAGVSVASVSYILSGKRKLSPETERRVRAAVRELGFAPNASARNLAVGKTNMLGVVVPDIRNPFFPEITTAFAESAALGEMETIVMSLQDDVQRSRIVLDRLLALQVSGVAMFTSQFPTGLRRHLVTRGVPAVYMDHAPTSLLQSMIGINYEMGIAEAMEYLVQLGHRRIGYVGGPEHLDSSIRRKSAFLECASQFSLESLTLVSDYTSPGGYFACSKLRRALPATAVVCANDLMAFGAMNYAHDHGIAVPEMFSIVGFDDISFAEYTHPSLTTVAVPRAEIGRIAFEALHSMGEDPSQAGKTFTVDTHLVIRKSAGAPAS